MIACGLVGLPNAGKSTLFNALTGSSVLTAPYPFSTKEPSEGIFFIPDKRIKYLANYYKSKKVVPPYIKIIDIAGLIKDAHKGEGLGNLFLSHIAMVDVIIHVVGAYDEDASPPSLNEKLQIILYELAIHDINIVENALKNLRKMSTGGSKSAQEQIPTLERYYTYLQNNDFLKSGFKTDNPEEISILKKWNLLVGRPSIAILNCSEATYQMCLTFSQTLNFPVIVADLKLMEEMKDMDVEERLLLLESSPYGDVYNKIAESIKKVANMICYFTCNENETRGRLTKKGTTSEEAAFQIHTEIGKGLIKTKVWKWEDAIQGKQPQIHGRDYIIQEGDVVYFVSK